MTTTLRRVGQRFSAISPNFCKVVKITPPDARQPLQVLAAFRLHRRLADQVRHIENVAKSWSSRSLRSVSTTSVGFCHPGA
jgi:hypothetical protein